MLRRKGEILHSRLTCANGHGYGFHAAASTLLVDPVTPTKLPMSAARIQNTAVNIPPPIRAGPPRTWSTDPLLTHEPRVKAIALPRQLVLTFRSPLEVQAPKPSVRDRDAVVH